LNAPLVNIRVYGLLAESGRVLVTDEFRLNTFMTKFPGGALEFGEGTLDCLRREFREELHTEIEIVSHFYTTDFFQQTELLPSNMQLINIYYTVKAPKPYRFPTTHRPFDFPEVVDGAQSFRWLNIATLKEEELTLPIDKRIVPMIREKL
jgi:8-oxo-dGTP diphosphatase